MSTASGTTEKPGAATPIAAAACPPPTPSATTDGPEPDSAAGMPAARSRPTRSAEAGMAGRRYGWCIRSSVAVSSSRERSSPAPAAGSAPDSASASSAARPMFTAASACGTCFGRAPRACSVDWRRDGTNTTGRSSPSGATRRDRGTSPSYQATVRPPSRAAATLSGCPSIALATRSRPAAPSGPPARASAAVTPATIAAADEPRPRPCGIRFTQRSASPGCAHSSSSKVARIARTTRCASSAGTASGPTTSMESPDGVSRTDTSSYSPSARPSASKPGPRLALVAGTRRRTAPGGRPPPGPVVLTVTLADALTIVLTRVLTETFADALAVPLPEALPAAPAARPSAVVTTAAGRGPWRRRPRSAGWSRASPRR
ncbi:hypothetical protein FMEAI12_3430010 [Parafrankia sp. Ea1.12]|nr:hypothetical protein FMEAI12_3430010 [Parafrankia sp. Ea1.12]